MTLASHKLNIFPMAEQVRQKMRRFHPDCHKIIQTEVDNLLGASFIREVKYPEWLANVVVVPKKGGKWRVCVHYTDCNTSKYTLIVFNVFRVFYRYNLNFS